MIDSHFSQFSIKVMVLSKTWIQACGPNKWDNSRLDLCISIGESVEPLYKIIFPKLFLVFSFNSTTNPLALKFFLATLEYLKKNLKLVWFSSLLEFEFKISFELESNSGIENMNEYLGGLYFHPILDTRSLFVKIKQQMTF